MTEITEVTAIQELDKILGQIEDPKVRDRVLRWVWARFSPTPHSMQDTGLSAVTRKNATTRKKADSSKRRVKRKTTLTFNKDLDLTPGDEVSLKEFAKEKNPTNNGEKCAVAVYYLSRIAKKCSVDRNDIYTCFKVIGWRLPANLDNALYWTASQEGWIDTSDMSNIVIPTHGENLIEQELPKQSEG